MCSLLFGLTAHYFIDIDMKTEVGHYAQHLETITDNWQVLEASFFPYEEIQISSNYITTEAEKNQNEVAGKDNRMAYLHILQKQFNLHSNQVNFLMGEVPMMLYTNHNELVYN